MPTTIPAMAPWLICPLLELASSFAPSAAPEVDAELGFDDVQLCPGHPDMPDPVQVGTPVGMNVPVQVGKVEGAPSLQPTSVGQVHLIWEQATYAKGGTQS